MSEGASNVPRLLRLVSPRVGLVRSLTRLSRGIEEPTPPIVYQAALSHFDLRKGDEVERSASGKGVSEEEAIGGALGEAVERYCSSLYDAGGFRRAAAAELEGEAIRPEELVLFSEEQRAREGFPYRYPEESTEVAWIEGRTLPDGEAVWLPASFVYLGYVGEGHDQLFAPPTSNGLAAGADLERALLGGLGELVERDAFLITWMNRLSAPEVDFRGCGGVAESIARHYAHFGIEARVFDVSSDIPVSVMMCVTVERSGEGPAAVVGLGAHLDPRRAVEKALMEVCQVRPAETHKLARRKAEEKLESYADVQELADHSSFFFDLERLAELDFLLESGRRVELSKLPDRSGEGPAEDLERTVAAVSGAGARVAYAELTTPDLEGYEVRVVRVLATGLQPIHFGHGQERLGGRRLFEVPARLGQAEGPRTPADLNPCPHPLA